MGTFQSGINNILNVSAVASKFIGESIQTSNLKKAQAQQTIIDKENEEAESTAQAQQKVDEALKMSVGYKQKDIEKQNAETDLGIVNPQKNPSGIRKEVYDRRSANAETMREILNKYIQNKDYRDRINKYSPETLSKVLNPQIRSKKQLKEVSITPEAKKTINKGENNNEQ